jgi:hypothetical protein
MGIALTLLKIGVIGVGVMFVMHKLNKIVAGIIVTGLLATLLVVGGGYYITKTGMASMRVTDGVFTAKVSFLNEGISIPLGSINEVKVDSSGDNPRVIVQREDGDDIEIVVPKWVLKSPGMVQEWVQVLKDIPELSEYSESIQSVVDELLGKVE